MEDLTDKIEVKADNNEICLLDTEDNKNRNRGRKAKNIVPFALMGDNSPPLPRAELIKELKGLIFEAKSARDFAWFDVATFLNHRVTYSDDLEVHLRFNGFDNTHDEWINVKTCLRERSIPLDHSECHRVNVGDLVICRRDAEYFGLYYDAYVIDIERNKHEGDNCNCVFVIQYDYDNFQEKVSAVRIRHRPSNKS